MAVVRRATKEDLSCVRTLAATSSTAAHWAHAVYDAYCSAGGSLSGPQKALFVAAIPADPAEARSSQPGEVSVVGFAAFSAFASAGECELENMMVTEAWRRQGLGARLLKAGLLWCRVWCPSTAMVRQAQIAGESACVRLEVRASNDAAIGFYEQAGFAMVGRRAGYYSAPEEDAILMRKPLGHEFLNTAAL